jgi:hypothetical protein
VRRNSTLEAASVAAKPVPTPKRIRCQRASGQIPSAAAAIHAAPYESRSEPARSTIMVAVALPRAARRLKD